MINKYEVGMNVKILRNWGDCKPGDVVNPDKLGWKIANVQMGINQNRLMLIPVTEEIEELYGTRFPRHRGAGQWDVIQGKKLNDKPLTKDEANKLVKTGV